MTPLRIGLVCHANFGGSGVIATELGLALARRGHDVHVVSAGAPPRLVLERNVTLHEVTTPTHPLFPHGEFGLALASRLIGVGRALDVLHVHYAIPLATSAVLARQVLGDAAPALVTTVHGTDVLTLGQDPAFRPMVRHALERSDLVTAPSRFLAARATALAEVPVEVVPNFVDVERFGPGVASARGPLVVHASNLRPVKRVRDVLELARRLPDTTFEIIGDGPERAAAQAFVQDERLKNVVFVGPSADIATRLKNARVFVLPSEVESFGLAALEAMSCGVPVVASNVGGLPEVIEHGVSGFLHPVGDVAAMSDSVRRLLTDDVLHAAMSNEARARAVAHFRLPPIVARWEALYRQLRNEP